MYRMLWGEDGAEGGAGGRWVKGDTLTSGVYESREYQRTTAGRLEYEIEGEKRGGGRPGHRVIRVKVRGRWKPRSRREDVTAT